MVSLKFGAIIEIHKNMRKTTLQPHYSCCIQENGSISRQSLKDDKFFQSDKIGHLAKAIAFPTMLGFGLNLIFTKTSENRIYNHVTVVLFKNGSKNKLIFEK